MLFNSPFFLLVFFPIVTGAYYLLPHRTRWGWLLLMSSYFYMGFIPKYILILAFTITIDYLAGILIEKSIGSDKRRLLVLSILSNIGVLAVFKYFDFFNANISALAQALHWNYSHESLALILPIGLSFHTFQSLSYVIEVYRGRQRAERHFGIFALYVMFYPQLVAGPIERPQNLLHQFREEHAFEAARFFSGIRLMIWGLFKKVVIADRAAIFVDQIYNNSADFSGAYYVLATILFAFQIYCDFSGYSDMARGLARTIGFELMVNFDAPYLSRSVSEFWRRWHISLSSWFRDYVYVPLGGSMVPRWRWQLNLIITFLLSGFWHGANWTFVAWGLLNGMYLIISLRTENIRTALSEALRLNGTALQRASRTVMTFILIGISWVFFRASSIAEAWRMLGRMAMEGYDLTSLIPYLLQHWSSLAIIAIAIATLLLVEIVLNDRVRRERIAHIPAGLQVAAFSLVSFMILLLGRFSNEQFIYFQF